MCDKDLQKVGSLRTCTEAQQCIVSRRDTLARRKNNLHALLDESVAAAAVVASEEDM